MGALESVMARFFGGSSLESHSGPRCQWFGNGSFASSITNPSMTCVSTFGLIIAFGRPPLSVVPVLLWGGGNPVPGLPPVVAVVVVGGCWGFVVGLPATVAVVLAVGVAGAADAECNPLALTATGVGAPKVAVVTGATVVAAAVAAAAAAAVVVVDAACELVVVVVNEEALVVVVVCGAVVVVLTAPAGSSDEATAGCPADADAVVVAADAAVAAVAGVLDTDDGWDAGAVCVGVAAVDVVVVVVAVSGAGDEVSIGVGPFNCASDALSAAAAVF